MTVVNNKLDLGFLEDSDVVAIARKLIGTALVTNIDQKFTKGMIVETEAYCGASDRACHAFPNKRTTRTETMFGPPGYAYIYLCYGMHHLFNIVTNKSGSADAVLIRAIEPLEGENIMLERRGSKKVDKKLTGGPARLTVAQGINTRHNGTKLDGDLIWLEEYKLFKSNEIASSARIGVDYAGEDAKLPWRFTLKENKYLSRE